MIVLCGCFVAARSCCPASIAENFANPLFQTPVDQARVQALEPASKPIESTTSARATAFSIQADATNRCSTPGYRLCVLKVWIHACRRIEKTKHAAAASLFAAYSSLPLK